MDLVSIPLNRVWLETKKQRRQDGNNKKSLNPLKSGLVGNGLMVQRLQLPHRLNPLKSGLVGNGYAIAIIIAKLKGLNPLKSGLVGNNLKTYS